MAINIIFILQIFYIYRYFTDILQMLLLPTVKAFLKSDEVIAKSSQC